MSSMKKMILLAAAAVLTVMTSACAFALGPAGYVPTKVKVYEYDSDARKWELTGTDTLSFSSDGKIKSFTEDRRKSGGTMDKTSYTWSGDLVKKVKTVTTLSPGKMSTSELYKYQDGRAISKVRKETGMETVTTSYTWDGTKTTGDEESLEVNDKNQLISKSWISCLVYRDTNKYTYYSNGNLKKTVFTDATFDGKVLSKATYTYQKNGFPKSMVKTAGRKTTMKETYSYRTKGGKIREVQVTVKEGYTTRYKYVITKWKKVSHMRNHDAFGMELPLY